METNTAVGDNTEITESRLKNEGLENVVVQYTENTQLCTSESVARKMADNQDENVYTKA